MAAPIDPDQLPAQRQCASRRVEKDSIRRDVEVSLTGGHSIRNAIHDRHCWPCDPERFRIQRLRKESRAPQVEEMTARGIARSEAAIDNGRFRSAINGMNDDPRVVPRFTCPGGKE